MRIRFPHRRGGMYVAVLMTATLVAIIGFSALAVTRVELRSAESGNDLVTASFCAQSAIEMGTLLLANDSSWRTTYTHDVWLSEQSLGNGTYTLKLVDESNESLTADTSAPVRLYGRGMAGDAVRTYSVLLEQDLAAQNLLSNPGFENGTSGWYLLSPGDADMELDKSDPHSGAACVSLSDRDYRWNGPAQDITSAVENGTTYEVVFWVNMDSSTDDIRGVFRIENAEGDVTYPQFQVTPGEGWVQISGTITASWSGELSSAELYIGTGADTDDFRADDVTVKVAGSTAPMVPVPGTWRREVE